MQRIPIILIIVLSIIVSCGSPRRIETNLAKENITAEDQRIAAGRLIFKNNCQKCHPNGEAGEGPSLNNIHLPGVLLRYRVRSKSFVLWLGKMPSFNKSEISKKEMDGLIAYMKAVRRPG